MKKSKGEYNMKLEKVKINKYKTYEIEQEVSIENDYTVLVGMNESGKTSLLEAITKANSYRTNDALSKFNVVTDYTRRFKKQLDKSGENPVAIELVFLLENTELKKLNGFLNTSYDTFSFKYSKKYDNTCAINYISNLDFEKLVIKEIPSLSISSQEFLNFTKSEFEEYKNKLNSEDNSELLEQIQAFKYLPSDELTIYNKINKTLNDQIILPNIPKILYYDEYSILENTVKIRDIKSSSDPKYETAKALLEVADIDINKLSIETSLLENYRSEIEATQAYITSEILKYWSTNKNLQFKFELTVENTSTYHPDQCLNVRIENSRTFTSLPFNARSKGFTWFVSFLVWFKKLQEDVDKNVIILLDEPGLNLHAAAQKDLLKFIKELSQTYQVIYTTHSPFMVDSSDLYKVRTICFDEEKGSLISDSIQQKDPNTLFPLQAALGYDIAQNLFISQNNLLVEGIADLVYLNYMSSILISKGREGLNEKITIVPVGGADKIVTFISLLRGNQLNIVCLLDTMIPSTSKKLNHLIDENILNSKKLITYGQILNKKYADVEDAFEIDDYIKIYNLTYGENIKKDQIDETKMKKGIVEAISEITQKFNHYLPAKTLLSTKIEISEKTLENFELIIKKINKLFN